MEKFDLVDEHDNVIGETDKPTSHADGGIHRCVAIYVFAPDGKLYVQDHIKSGLFDHSVGGHVSKGEDYDIAAVREGTEELGLVDPLAKLANFYSDERAGGSNIRHYFGLYECTPTPSWKFEPNDEVQMIIPMTIEEIVKLMNNEPRRFTGGFINTMSEYLKIKNLPYNLT